MWPRLFETEVTSDTFFSSSRFPLVESGPGVAFTAGRGKSGGGGRSTVGGRGPTTGKAKKSAAPKSTGRRGGSTIGSPKAGSSARRSASAKVSTRKGRAGAERERG